MTKTNTTAAGTMMRDSQSVSNLILSKGKLLKMVPSFLKWNTKNHIPTTDGSVAEEVLTVEQNFERGFLSVASQQLIDREECLFGQISDQLTRGDHKEEEEQIARNYEVLRRHLEQAWKESLNPEQNTEILKCAVKVLQQEEKQDRQWKARLRTPSAWRPGRYGELHDSVLRSLVKERLDNGETSPLQENEQEQTSCIQEDVCRMAKRMEEDLLIVVKVVKGCYPDEMNICNLYAKMYHQAFGARMMKIAEYELCAKDSSYLLCWVNDHYPRMLKRQEFMKEINQEALGKLLPSEVTKPLEEDFLTHIQEKVQTYTERMLKEQEQAWVGGAEPELRDRCYQSPLAVDVVQCIDSNSKSAEVVLGGREAAQVIVSLLKDFLNSFKNFQEEVLIKSKNKGNSRAVVMANLICVEQFRDYIEKKTDLFPEDVKECCLSIVTAVKTSSYGFILSPIHKKLKPQYRSLGTSNWLEKESVFEELLAAIEKHTEDLRGLSDSCHQELMGQFHQDVTVEYVRRLLKGNIKLKDKKKQEQAAEVVCDNGQALHTFFISEGSRKRWLTEILTWIAEVLKLQDVSSLQMELGTQAVAYPDLSDKHVSALLKLKSNLSNADKTKVKNAFLDYQQESRSDVERAFFSKVVVK